MIKEETMSASKEELEQAVRDNVACLTKCIVRGYFTKQELLDLIEQELSDLGYT